MKDLRIVGVPVAILTSHFRNIGQQRCHLNELPNCCYSLEYMTHYMQRHYERILCYVIRVGLTGSEITTLRM